MLWTPLLGSDKGPWSQVLVFSCELCKKFMTTLPFLQNTSDGLFLKGETVKRKEAFQRKPS